MSAVGYDLYCQMLDETVKELRGAEKEEYIETTIEVPINAYIPDTYIDEQVIKIETYKKIASIENSEDKMDMEEELTDRFGDIPKPLENLINIAYIRGMAKRHRITGIKQVGKDLLIQFKDLEHMSFDDIKQMNEKMNNSISYAASNQPVLKVKMSGFTNSDIIKILKDFVETISDLHKIKK
jgi:transcription-repair coupling factor (superfamily II helicase)